MVEAGRALRAASEKRGQEIRLNGVNSFLQVTHFYNIVFFNLCCLVLFTVKKCRLMTTSILSPPTDTAMVSQTVICNFIVHRYINNVFV